MIGALDVAGDPPEHAGTVVFRVFWVFRRHATERVSVSVCSPLWGDTHHARRHSHTGGSPLVGPAHLGPLWRGPWVDVLGPLRPSAIPTSASPRRRVPSLASDGPVRKRKEMTAPHRELHRPASRRCCGGASRAERRA